MIGWTGEDHRIEIASGLVAAMIPGGDDNHRIGPQVPGALLLVALDLHILDHLPAHVPCRQNEKDWLRSEACHRKKANPPSKPGPHRGSSEHAPGPCRAVASAHRGHVQGQRVLQNHRPVKNHRVARRPTVAARHPETILPIIESRVKFTTRETMPPNRLRNPGVAITTRKVSACAAIFASMITVPILLSSMTSVCQLCFN